MGEWQKENCNNCNNRIICRFQQNIRTVNTMELPTWELIGTIQDFLKSLLPQKCGRFEAIQEYENRDASGRVIGRKPLKLWYPNQEQPEEPHSWYDYNPNCGCRGCQNSRSYSRQRSLTRQR